MNQVEHMVVADPLAAFHEEGMLKIIAPAKINLFLGVGAIREDGFHDVTNIMHTLTLHDVFHLDYEQQSAGGLVVEASCFAREGLEPLILDSDDNLAVKAIKMLAEKLGRKQDETFRLRIEKHIPHQAGLGGGSSDAAAALVGAAHVWGVNPLAPQVVESAAALGSDVAFFLHGGCACFLGKGEQLSHTLEPFKKPIVIIKPKRGASTAEVYQAFDKAPVVLPDETINNALAAPKAENVMLLNNLFQAAQSVVPELTEIHAWLKNQEGVEDVLLSGSGSATFAICDSFNVACALSAGARKHGWWSRATTFSALGASIVPKKKI